MKIWKRNAVVLTVFIFVCAGIYLNWIYTEQATAVSLEDVLNEEQIMGEDTLVLAEHSTEESLLEVAGEGLTEELNDHADYFAAMRLSRQEARDSAIETLQETIAYAGTEDSNTTTSKQLENLVQVSLSEAQIESLIIAKGYADCVAYMSDEGISVAVSAPAEGLTDSDVSLLTDIITGQSEYELSQIRIIEVK